MKRTFTLLWLVIFSATSMFAWKPLLVGHRGSSIGVENTRESFINGVEINGFDGLECDVRVTADGQYVISHDETTSRLGGSLTVADASFEELAAESYSQTRGGVTYTGSICTVAEYLDICLEKGVFPVMELKWARGINNNDMSSFPGLVELVSQKGLLDRVVFLTSMQSSLLYIREHYPTVKCQFLCTSLAESKVEWCRDNGIEPSISVGYFDQQLLLKYHNAGLSCACWVVDSEANYRKYGEMGMQMITSNSLKKHELPQLTEIDWSSVPEAVEPLSLIVEKVWTRTVADDNLPVNFPAGTNATYKTGQQAAVIDGCFMISDYGTAKLLTIDQSCTEAAISDGFPMHGITTDDADNLIQRGEAGYSSMPATVYITRKGESTSQRVDFTIPADATGQANFVAASGDVFSAEGGYVYVYPNGQKTVYAVHIAGGEFKELLTYPGLSIAASTAGIVIPYSADDPAKFLYMVRNQGFYRYDNGDRGALLTGSSTTAPARNSSLGGAFFNIDGHEILVHPSGKNYCGGFSIKDVTAANATLATIPELGSTASAYGSNPSVGSFFKAEKVGESTVDLYFYTMGFGYGLYRLSAGVTAVRPIAAGSSLRVWHDGRTAMLHVEADGPIGIISIYSIAGTLLHSTTGSRSSASIDTSGLMPGLYVVTTATRSAKFIKQ